MADNYTFKDASGNTVTHASEEISAGVHASRHVSVDDAGVMLAKAEDAAHSSGDKGIMLLAVRKDSAGALAGADGDYIPLIVDSLGRLHIAPSAAAGDVAHDAADSGNPIKIGGKARSALPTAVAANDRVDAYLDAYGRVVVVSGVAEDADSAALALNAMPLGAIYRTDDNVLASGITDSNGRAAALRMTRERELLVAPRSLGARFDSSIVYARGALLSITSMTAGFATPVANDFSGAANWTSTAARYLKIPMRYFPNGISIGMYQNLGSALSVEIYSEIMKSATPTANFLLHRSAISVASGTFAYIQPYTLDVTAAANCYALPSLLMPMHSVILKMTAASAPSSGQVMIYLNR